MTLRPILACLVIACALVRPAAAITFAFQVNGSDTLSSAQAAAFNTAAGVWSSLLTDKITVTLRIGFSSHLASGVLGATSPSLFSGSTAEVNALLTADATTQADATAVASLPLAPTGQSTITSAQYKALGGVYLGTDGVIEFSSDYSFSTQRQSNGSVAAGTYDLIGIAEHEIGHVLGFASSIDDATSNPTILDEFRYGAPGVRSLTAGQAAYFSLDGGITNLAGFSVGGPGQRQASHWLTGTGAVLDPTFATGEARNITSLDALALDVIGYDAVQVPEPPTLLVLLSACSMLAWTRRRLDAGLDAPPGLTRRRPGVQAER